MMHFRVVVSQTDHSTLGAGRKTTLALMATALYVMDDTHGSSGPRERHVPIVGTLQAYNTTIKGHVVDPTSNVNKTKNTMTSCSGNKL